MHVLIIGAAGMIGRKFLDRISAEPDVLGQEIDKLTLVDVVAPTAPPEFESITSSQAADLADAGVAARLIATRPDLIIHLAAVVSGEAEMDFEKGYRVNLEGTQALLEAIRLEGRNAPYKPRLVYASSIAVYGAPFAPTISDDFALYPLTSYGTQKAIGELLLADYSRKGFLEGIGIRLPTICIRPGKPNKAASGFFSNILREPLVGQEAVLPVDENVRHWFTSPRSAVGFFVHASTMDLGPVGPRINLSMPGLSATVGEEIEALRRVAGDDTVKLIRRVPDPAIQAIVAGWATNFEGRRARELGFTAETDFDDIIRAHIEDELEGRVGG
ncbi:SDR family oxidoreductase [Aureimonas fodinaquatilis]|uniref:SDR family oxidoreductase n=1 Tax=Aureimonas fodinaquatilis TaxID=2565783 RepID=A0A5B0DSM0_9HYPH|nr:D-erythronate dehydrogenase [Aureimonas fodinaquatilis]KAA0968985.1 SDR family oxidoreductase [Aureimonas fodinaquatilis]